MWLLATGLDSTDLDKYHLIELRFLKKYKNEKEKKTNQKCVL